MRCISDFPATADRRIVHRDAILPLRRPSSTPTRLQPLYKFPCCAPFIVDKRHIISWTSMTYSEIFNPSSVVQERRVDPRRRVEHRLYRDRCPKLGTEIGTILPPVPCRTGADVRVLRERYMVDAVGKPRHHKPTTWSPGPRSSSAGRRVLGPGPGRTVHLCHHQGRGTKGFVFVRVSSMFGTGIPSSKGQWGSPGVPGHPAHGRHALRQPGVLVHHACVVAPRPAQIGCSRRAVRADGRMVDHVPERVVAAAARRGHVSVANSLSKQVSNSQVSCGARGLGNRRLPGVLTWMTECVIQTLLSVQHEVFLRQCGVASWVRVISGGCEVVYESGWTDDACCPKI